MNRLRRALRQLARARMACTKPESSIATSSPRTSWSRKKAASSFWISVWLLKLKTRSGRTASRFAGTPDYMSPEQGAAASAFARSDWYSVGVMLYQALTARLPFAGKFLRSNDEQTKLRSTSAGRADEKHSEELSTTFASGCCRRKRKKDQRAEKFCGLLGYGKTGPLQAAYHVHARHVLIQTSAFVAVNVSCASSKMLSP